MPVYCFTCENIFTTQSNLNRHKREVHNEYNDNDSVQYDQNVTQFRCLEGCNISFKYNNDLRNHLETVHQFENIICNMSFPSFKEFELWLETEEREKDIRFCRSRGLIRFQENNLEKTYLDCSRSGTEKHHESKRSKKSQGSAKLNRFCTSQIIVTRNTTNDKCWIQYFGSHYGHDREIQHLNLSKGYRKEVAAKLLMGVSSTHIIDSARENITGSLKREDLITRKDINNIKVSFNINLKDGCRHKEDAVSVSLWVKECAKHETSPILFFKMQGEEIDNCDLNKNDFCLVLMTKVQIEIFKKFGKNICVDGTHGLNGYDFEMTTVLVLDEFKEGFPVAFLFSNRKDSYIYELFFTKIRAATEVNDYSCNTFMSDVSNTYYNAWIKTMGAVTNKLFCSWHVDRAWQQNLNKIADQEKREWVFKTLKYLQRNLNMNEFEKEFGNFLNILSSDQVTENMFQYLNEYYYDNRKEWAYCYRKMCGINTNMFLESMHKTIKYTYLNGKKTKRLDKTLHALQKFLRDKTVERIIKLTKGQSGKHLQIIKTRHRVSLTETYHIEKNENGLDWILTDKKNYNNNIYFITKKNENVCCELKCMHCNICIHMYECTCLDYNIKTTICKHIHYLCINDTDVSHKDMSLNMNTAEKVGEVDNLTEELQRYSQSCPPKDIKSEIKSSALQLLTNVDNLHYSNDEQIFILRNLRVLSSMGSVEKKEVKNICLKNINGTGDEVKLSNSPANKNIKKQSFFSTKKKSQKKKRMSKPNFDECSIIKETLSHSLYTSNDTNHDHKYC